MRHLSVVASRGLAADAAAAPKCGLCGARLTQRDISTDAANSGHCAECRKHPAASQPVRPPSFRPADLALIQRLHAYMPADRLLDLLNTRLLADIDGAAPFTLEQLQSEIRRVGASGGEHASSGWAAMRKALAHARLSGTLDQVSEVTISDFAIVFSLSPAQVLRLKDALMSNDGHDGDRA